MERANARSASEEFFKGPHGATLLVQRLCNRTREPGRSTLVVANWKDERRPGADHRCTSRWAIGLSSGLSDPHDKDTYVIAVDAEKYGFYSCSIQQFS